MARLTDKHYAGGVTEFLDPSTGRIRDSASCDEELTYVHLLTYNQDEVTCEACLAWLVKARRKAVLIWLVVFALVVFALVALVG